MVEVLCFGGLAALAVVFVLYLYRLRQRRKWATSTTRFSPHVNASGDFMCFSLGKSLPAPPVHTDKT